MGHVLHGSARTTAAVRRAIQHSQEGLTVLAQRYGINPRTVAKWRKRSSTHDACKSHNLIVSSLIFPGLTVCRAAMVRTRLCITVLCAGTGWASLTVLLRNWQARRERRIDG